MGEKQMTTHEAQGLKELQKMFGECYREKLISKELFMKLSSNLIHHIKKEYIQYVE